MPTVIVMRWISQADLEAALEVCPAGCRVGLDRSLNLFAHEDMPVTWECDFEEPPTPQQQADVGAAVSNALRLKGIAWSQSSNGITT